MSDDLPEGWIEASLPEVAQLSMGQSPPSSTYNTQKRGLPFFQGKAEFGALYPTPRKFCSAPVKVAEPEDIVLSVRAPVGPTNLCRERSCIGRGLAAIHPLGGIPSRYLLFGLRNIEAWLATQGTGSTFTAISKSDLEQLQVPLAPLAEQRRIVEKLEQLLATVDACQQRLEKVPALLKRFRQSVLAAACSGRLTTDWRAAHPQRVTGNELLEEIRNRRKDLFSAERTKRGLPLRRCPEPARPSDEFDFEKPNSWTRCSVDDLTTTITSGSRDWTRYYRQDASGTFIMAQNVRPLKFDRSYRLGVAPPKNDRDRTRSEVRKDDLLVTIVGANTGDSCRVPLILEEHYVCQSVALMRPVLADTSRFLELFLNSPEHGLAEYRKWMYGEGRPHLSFDHLRETVINLPPLAEQREIIGRVGQLFTLVDQLEVRLTSAQANVNRLISALLAKAFRGELVPTEAELARQEGRDYEPASILLERLQRERAGNVARSNASTGAGKVRCAARSPRRAAMSR